MKQININLFDEQTLSREFSGYEPEHLFNDYSVDSIKSQQYDKDGMIPSCVVDRGLIILSNLKFEIERAISKLWLKIEEDGITLVSWTPDDVTSYMKGVSNTHRKEELDDERSLILNKNLLSRFLANNEDLFKHWYLICDTNRDEVPSDMRNIWYGIITTYLEQSIAKNSLPEVLPWNRDACSVKHLARYANFSEYLVEEITSYEFNRNWFFVTDDEDNDTFYLTRIMILRAISDSIEYLATYTGYDDETGAIAQSFFNKEFLDDAIYDGYDMMCECLSIMDYHNDENSQSWDKTISIGILNTNLSELYPMTRHTYDPWTIIRNAVFPTQPWDDGRKILYHVYNNRRDMQRIYARLIKEYWL